MLPELEQLLILQDRDRKLRALEQELKTVPLQRVELEKKTADLDARAGKLRHKLKEIEVGRKNLELDAQGKREAISKFKTQQFQTRKNEEFQALNNEIARFEKDIRRIEDEELDLMEQAEKVRPEIAAAEREAADAKQKVNNQLADLDAKKAALEQQITEVGVERTQLAADVDEDLRDRYDRLFSSKRDFAVVALEHSVCTGCHMKNTTQTAACVKAGKEIVSCEQCGRILYFSE